MDKLFKTIALGLLLSLLGCADEAQIQTKSYPFLETLSVTDIDETGATFNAKVLNYGTEEATDYGFIWTDGLSTYKYSIKGQNSLANFNLRLVTDLDEDITYICKAYIQTDKHLVYGNPTYFVSHGSTSPLIEDFSPKEGPDGTIVVIKGKFFSLYPNRNQVFVNDQRATVIASTDSSITIKTPISSSIGNVKISIKVGTQISISSAAFNTIGPEITFISNLTGVPGDWIIIKGNNFLKNGTAVNVKFDDQLAQVTSSSDNQLEVIIPPLSPLTNHMIDNSLKISLINGSKVVNYEHPFAINKLWVKKCAPPFTGNLFYGSFTYKNKGYILELNSKVLFEYDPSTDSWSDIGAAIYPGKKAENALYITSFDKVYKLGGFDGYSYTSQELVVFNFLDKTWTKMNPLPFEVSKGTFFELNHKLYVATSRGQLWLCDLINGQYTRLNDLPANLNYFWLASFVNSGQAYLVDFTSTWRYNENDDSWTNLNLNPFITNGDSPICFTVNEQAYVLERRVLYKYDLVLNIWKQVSYYPVSGNGTRNTIFCIEDNAYFAATYSYSPSGAPALYSYQE